MNSVVTTYSHALPEATSTSLSLPETLTFEQWEEIGSELANRARKLNWWIGDWWAAGHHRYGERARLAARGLFGKEFKTLANIASVCRAFEPARRREHLSWSHHAEAAALSPVAADMLLDLAERDRLSKAQVRSAVITIRGGPPSRTTPDAAAVAGLFRTYNRLPGAVRLLVAQAFAAVAASGAEIDPATGNPKGEASAGSASQPADAAWNEATFNLAEEMAAERYVDDELALGEAGPNGGTEPGITCALAASAEDRPVELSLAAATTCDPGTAASSAGAAPVFDLEAAMDLEPPAQDQPGETPMARALPLGIDAVGAEEAERKAPASETETWLLP